MIGLSPTYPGVGSLCLKEADASDKSEVTGRQVAILKAVCAGTREKTNKSKVLEAKLSNLRWQQWKEVELKGLAFTAFRFARLPEEWRPPSCVDLGGKVRESAGEILEAEHGNYSKFWKAQEAPRPLKPLCFEESGLARPLVSKLRRSFRRFKKKTAKHPADGVLMRQADLVPDVGLESLIDIFLCMEGLGELPISAALIMILLLPSPRAATGPSAGIHLSTGRGRRLGKARRPNWNGRSAGATLLRVKDLRRQMLCGGRCFPTALPSTLATPSPKSPKSFASFTS